MKKMLSAVQMMSAGIQLHTVGIKQAFTIVDKTLEAALRPVIVQKD